MSKIYTQYEKNDGRTTDVVLRSYLDRREVADPIISRETTVAIVEDLVDASVDIPEDNEVYIEHYGVKGQKWGVRRTPAQLGRKIKGKLKDVKKNKKSAEEITNTSVSKVKNWAKENPEEVAFLAATVAVTATKLGVMAYGNRSLKKAYDAKNYGPGMYGTSKVAGPNWTMTSSKRAVSTPPSVNDLLKRSGFR